MQWFATGKSITTSVAFINQRFSGSALVAAEIIKTIKSSRSELPRNIRFMYATGTETVVYRRPMRSVLKQNPDQKKTLNSPKSAEVLHSQACME